MSYRGIVDTNADEMTEVLETVGANISALGDIIGANDNGVIGYMVYMYNNRMYGVTGYYHPDWKEDCEILGIAPGAIPFAIYCRIKGFEYKKENIV